MLNGIQYPKILKTYLRSSAENLKIDQSNTIFMQDNAIYHTSNQMKNDFTEQNINDMIWPMQSPDLNPIENLWSVIKLMLSKKIFQSKEALIESFIVDWTSFIGGDICKNLRKCMPGIFNKVFKSNGGSISYERNFLVFLVN